jgi:hypothetical protein
MTTATTNTMIPITTTVLTSATVLDQTHLWSASDSILNYQNM